MDELYFKKINDFKNFFSSKEIRLIFKIFSLANIPCRIVGGSIRDILMGKKINDVDFAVATEPNVVCEIIKKFNELIEENKNNFLKYEKNFNYNFYEVFFNNLKNEKKFLDFNCKKILVIETGLKHGTLTLNINGKNFEITSLRIDKNCDGRHADVVFTDNFFLDSKRRDFTINAFYMDENYKFFDYHDGITDLKNLKLKFIGNPNERINEDYLRILRYYRFLAVMNENEKTLKQKKTDESILFYKEKLLTISKERIQDELLKMVKIKNVENVFSLMNFDKISETLFTINFNIKNFVKTKNEMKKFNKNFKVIFFKLLESNFSKSSDIEFYENDFYKMFSHFEKFFLIESLFDSENNLINDYLDSNNINFNFRKFFKFSKKDFLFLKELQKIKQKFQKIKVYSKKNLNFFLKNFTNELFYSLIITSNNEFQKYFYLLKIIIFLNEMCLNNEIEYKSNNFLKNEINELINKIFILKNFPLSGFDVIKNFKMIEKIIINDVILKTKIFWLKGYEINNNPESEKLKCLNFISEYLKNRKD